MIILINIGYRYTNKGAYMPVTLFSEGDHVIVIMVKGNDEVRKHLSNLGIVKGKELILQRFDGVNYVFLIEGNKLALSKDIAKRIFVEEVR